MAKRRKNYKRSSKSLGPLDTFIDLAGAATLGAYVKHKVKKIMHVEKERHQQKLLPWFLVPDHYAGVAAALLT